MGYDIIGDVHGHNDKLEGLLARMGYRKTAAAWRHPDRQAIFVGDFIDRGPHQGDVLDTVRRMVDAGSAQALMGNHEFNAIAWHTEDPDQPGQHLRPRHGERGDKNRKQHQAFLSEFENDPAKHQEVIDWFYTLPLWLELPGLRVVHACWHDRHMRFLRPRLAPGTRLTPELTVPASRPFDPHYVAVEAILKGVEARLPNNITFNDKDGHVRDAVRLRWWDPAARTYRQAAVADGKEDRLPDIPIDPALLVTYRPDKPVFFGHYWFKGPPSVVAPHAACVDYSVAKDGPLVAYRWSGEAALDSKNYVAF
jgi:hypothetical protein